MDLVNRITINKNRGWRGLAEIKCFDDDNVVMSDMIFSFSQPVWEDMLDGKIVIQTKTEYVVLSFNNTDELPTGQRSVLLKDFTADVIEQHEYSKSAWEDNAVKFGDYANIVHFIKNSNNHTRSDWNCIGIRVIPNI